MVGGGVATFDCYGDGFPDLFLSGGQRPFGASTASRRPQGGALAFDEAQTQRRWSRPA